MSKQERYPHGCDVDYLNEQVAEAMHAAHCEEHEAYPQKGCQWCEAEEQAEREAQAENEAAGIPQDFQRWVYAACDADDAEQEAQQPPVVLVKCPQCRALNVKGMYCTGCGWVPVREN